MDKVEERIEELEGQLKRMQLRLDMFELQVQVVEAGVRDALHEAYLAYDKAAGLPIPARRSVVDAIMGR